MVQEFFSLVNDHSKLDIRDILSLTISTKPISTNHATKHRIIKNKAMFFKTEDYKRLEYITFASMSANMNCLIFKENFKEKHYGIIAFYTIHIPEKHYYDAKGLIPLKRNDVDNFVKPVKDIMFKWFGFDDSHVIIDCAEKKCSDKWGYEIKMLSFDHKKREN